MTEPKRIVPRTKFQLNIHSICVFTIAVYMLLLPFEYVFSSAAGSLSKYVGVLVMVACLISGSFRFSLKRSNLLIIGFLLYGIVSGLWAISTEYYVSVFLSYLKNAALFLVVAQCRFTKKQVDFILNFFVIGALLLAVYTMTSSNAVIDPYSGRTVIEINGGRFDPNYMAAIIILPMGYMYGVFYNSLTQKRYLTAIFAVATVVLLFYVEILSGSRGGLLAIVGMIFTITLLQLKTREVRRKFVYIAVAIVVVLTVVMQLLPEQIADRFSLESLLGETDEGGGRLALWDAAWKAIKARPVFGYGAGCAIPAVGIYNKLDRAAHSLYLSSWLEFGVFSLLLYVSIFQQIKKTFKNRQYTYVGMAVGILIASIFLDALSTKFFWAFLMILFMRNTALEVTDEQ